MARVLTAEERDRSRQIRYESAVREVPRILLWFSAIVVLYDLTAAATGTIFPIAYYLSDLVQLSCMLLVTWLIRTRRAPLRAAPWLFIFSLLVSASVLSLQQVVEPDAVTLPIMMIGVLVVGGLALFWAPFWVGGIPMIVFIGATANMVYPEQGDDWALAAATGLAASAAMLVSRKRSAESLAVAQLRAERLATQDASTDLLNRRGLGISAPALFSLAQRQGADVFVAFMDIDGLKGVNDHHGHAVGDDVILRVAKAISSASRDIDLVVRWGGDEFLVVGLGPAPDREIYLERVLAALDRNGLDGDWSGHISLGIASGPASTDIDVLIRQADAAMYLERKPERA